MRPIGGSAPKCVVGYRSIYQAGHLHHAVLGQVVDQSRVQNVAVNDEGWLVSSLRNMRGILVSRRNSIASVPEINRFMRSSDSCATEQYWRRIRCRQIAFAGVFFDQVGTFAEIGQVFGKWPLLS